MRLWDWVLKFISGDWDDYPGQGCVSCCNHNEVLDGWVECDEYEDENLEELTA